MDNTTTFFENGKHSEFINDSAIFPDPSIRTIYDYEFFVSQSNGHSNFSKMETELGIELPRKGYLKLTMYISLEGRDVNECIKLPNGVTNITYEFVDNVEK